MRYLKTKVLLGIISLTLIVGCVENGERIGWKKTDKFKIGAVVPLTGGVATYGKSLQKGFDLAVKEENGKYGIIYEDSKADKRVGVTAINKLIDFDRVKFVLGDATSGVMLAIAPVAEKNKIILFDAIATSDDIRNSGDYVFRNAPSNFKQARRAALFIKNDLKVSDVAIIYNQNDYGVNLSENFRAELKRNNSYVVYDNGYKDKTTDFKSMLIKLKASNAKAVFVPGNYEETALMLRQARQMGINIPFVGTDGAYSPKLIEIAGLATNDFYLTMMGVDESNEMYQKFVLGYRDVNKSEPDVFSAYGYEAAKILFAAINAVGYDPQKVKKYLYQNEFDSLTGKLRFDKDGEVIREYVMLKVVNGSFTQ